MNFKKHSRREKIFYILSLLLILTMLFGMISVAFIPR
ncbi:hypothetical protein BH10CHL1_BH10CHL1_20490 [soil metagenome]